MTFRQNPLSALALVCAVFLTIMIFTQRPSHAATIVAGVDFFTTDDAEVDLPGIGNVKLKGFPNPNLLFPTPAFPAVERVLFIITWVDAHGNEVEANSVHAVRQVVTPRPDLQPFDTAVRRNADVTPTPAGEVVPIEIVWLSLMSVDPVDVSGLGLVDLYVGLSSTTSQIEGRMKLTSTTRLSGFADLGLKGVTVEDPLDPDFLGLPVVYDVLFIPHGLSPHPDNLVHRVNNLLHIFHGNSMSPSGRYELIPEPSGLAVWGLLATLGISVGCRRRKASRRERG